MKPTQQEIIELAREAGVDTYPEWLHGIPTVALERFATLLLERFGAGGGEPVNQWRKVGTGQWWDGFPDHSDSGGPYETRTLYTHPSPTDLQAEYLRGLEDGFKEGWIECSKWAQRDDLIADIGSPSYEACVSAVKALKGKQ